MKCIRRLLSLTFILGMIIDVSADTGTINYCLTMNMADVATGEVEIEGTKFSTVSIAGLGQSTSDNEPTLPVKYASFQVPTYCNNISARILSSKFIGSTTVDYALLPGFSIPTRSDFSLEPEMYATTGQGYSQVVDGPKVEVCDEFFVNGNDHIVTIGIYPAAYKHNAKELNFYSNIKVELNYQTCGKHDMKFEPFENDSVKVIDVSLLVENPDDSGKQRIGNYENGNTIIPLKNYVILVPENLKSYVNRLAKWKEQKGYNVKIQTVEDILNDPNFAVGSKTECFDKESSVREWLKSYKSQLNAAFFCLIIGDYRTTAPIRKFRESSPLKDPNARAYSPSDAYFSDLISKWSMTKDPSGLYSCNLLNISLSQTIPIGRLLCSTGEEIERYTDKLLLYELFPGRGDMDYLNNGFAFQEYDAQKYECPTIFNALTDFNVDFKNDNHVDRFSELQPSGKDVIAAMNRKGILSWQGHGDPVSIECASLSDKNPWPNKRYIMAQLEYQDFHDRYQHDSMHGLDCLSNENYPSVAYSISCCITPFDALLGAWDKGYINRYNVGSAFTVAGKYGGVALLGNTRDGYFESSDSLELEFGKHLLKNSCIGIAEMYSKTTFSGKYATDVKKIKFRHNIIGDPEFNIWTAKPISFTGTTMVRDNILRLSGNSLTTGFYGISSKNYVYQGEYTSSNNTLTLSLSKGFVNSQIATVYIWQNNYLPFIQIVTTGKEIVDDNRDIFLTEAYLSSDANNGKTYQIGHCPAYLNIGANSNININALKKITSDGGISIRKQGSLTLYTENAVLKNDLVETGGNLNVRAHQITLDTGVTIEAGASVNFSTY